MEVNAMNTRTRLQLLPDRRLERKRPRLQLSPGKATGTVALQSQAMRTVITPRGLTDCD